MNLGVTPGICGIIGKRAQVILTWVKAVHTHRTESHTIKKTPMNQDKVIEFNEE
jgi:hypothetical protein